MENELTKVYIKTDEIVAREVEEELIIIPLTAGVGDMEDAIFGLDETAKEIWNLIDGKKSLKEIVETLEEEYNASPGTIQKDVLGLIRELSPRGFIKTVDSN